MEFNNSIRVAGHLISKESEVFIIAEAGVNHNGDMKQAKKMIDVAIEAKANAVKFQYFKTEHVIIKNIAKAPYQEKTTDPLESQYDMLKKLEVSNEANKELKRYCDNKGILFLTTSFDEVTLDELDELDLPAYKVASTDLTNLPFLKKVAQKGKPIFLSTGMSYIGEVEIALKEIFPFNKDVILLQCSANYPIMDDEVNLNVINTYKEQFNMLVGYSDHTVGVGAAPYAVAMGAKVIEKHFTLDKSSVGPDHRASLNPNELIELVEEIRKVEIYLGLKIKIPSLSEIKTRASLQKCLVAAEEIRKGEMFSEKNIVAKRTGGIGVSPIYYKRIIGRTADKNYKKDDIVN